MSSQELPPPQTSPQQNPPAQEQPPAIQQFTEAQQLAYNKMMSTIEHMNSKIEKAKKKMHNQPITDKKTKTDEMTDKLIQSKQSSQIITKENLLTDITESYEKVVIEVYSENGKLKKKIQEMAKLIKQQNNKLYDYTKKEKQIVTENEQLRSQIAKLKDEKLILARGGHVVNPNTQRQNVKQDQNVKKKTNQTATNQNEDFDFWSMPQNQYGKKKKDFVQDSSLWVNQKEVHDSVFITEDQTGGKKKK